MTDEQNPPPSRLAAVINLDLKGLKDLNRRADEIVPLAAAPGQEAGQDQTAPFRQEP